MSRILFIVGSYYPNCSAVGRCMGNIADILAETNDVTILASITETAEPLHDMRENQKIIRIYTKNMYRDIYCREQLKKGKKQYVIGCRFYQLLRLYHAVFSTNSLNKTLVKEYVKALDNLEEIPDIIIPTCIPFDTVKAALLYKKKHPDCKVIPVIYDMFAASGRLQRFSWNQKIKWKQNQLLEKEMLQECTKVLHMPSWTPYIQQYFGDYKKNCVEVEHPLLVRPNSQKKVFYEKGYFHIIYTGTVDIYIRNPEYVLKFFKTIVFKTNIQIHFYSMGSAQYLIEEAASNQKEIISHGQVNGDEAYAAINSADMLLSIGNREKTQIPSKVFEYMSTGKPIVHFSYTEQDPVRALLNNYPLACCFLMDENLQKSQQNEFTAFMETKGKEEISFETVSSLFKTANASYTSELLINTANKESITMTFAGGVMKNYVEVDYLFALIEDERINTLSKVCFYSKGNGCDLIEKTRVNAINYGWIPHDLLMQKLENSSILISIAEKRGKQISSKIFEYMSLGKPILHLYYNDSDVNLQYMKKYPLALCLKAKSDFLQDNRDKLYNWIINTYGLRVPFRKVELIFKKMMPEYISKKINVYIADETPDPFDSMSTTCKL